MAWKSLNNNISVDINTIVTPSTSYKSVVTFLNPADRVNLYPFKIVPLSWLISIGKYSNTVPNFSPYGYGSGLTGQTFYCYTNSFDGSEPYIPLGALIVPQLVGSVDYPVLLIVNDPLYATFSKVMLDPGYGINQTVPYMQYPPITTDEQSAGIVGTGWGLINNNGIGSYSAIVNSDYLFNPSGYISEVIGYKASSFGFINIFNTSPFYTFAGHFTVTGGNSYFFDIMPNILRASCCDNTVPNGISASQVCGTSIMGSSVCGDYMNNFCQGDNLLTDQCFNYCTTNNCNTNLNTYCQSKTVDTSSPNYTRTCACYNTNKFYQDWRNTSFSFLPESQREFLISSLPPVRPQCSYPLCAAAQSILPFGTTSADCPANQVQLCLNNSSLNIEGKVTGSVNPNSFIQCSQKSGLLPSGDNPTTNPNGNNPTTNPNGNNPNDNKIAYAHQVVQGESSSRIGPNKSVIIISVVVVICILVIILIYMFH